MMEIDVAPAGFCGQRALRPTVASRVATVLQSRDVRDGADSVALVGRTTRDRAHQRSVGAVGPLVRIASRTPRAGPPSVHGTRSAAGARDRHGARDALPGNLRSEA